MYIYIYTLSYTLSETFNQNDRKLIPMVCTIGIGITIEIQTPRLVLCTMISICKLHCNQHTRLQPIMSSLGTYHSAVPIMTHFYGKFHNLPKQPTISRTGLVLADFSTCSSLVLYCKLGSNHHYAVIILCSLTYNS